MTVSSSLFGILQPSVSYYKQREGNSAFPADCGRHGESEEGTEEAAVEPDVGHNEERDGRHQDEMDAPDDRGRAWAAVMQDRAHGQLEKEQDQSDGGEPQAVGEARRDVARAQPRPGMPRRQSCKGQGKPVMRPEGHERRRRRGVVRAAPAPHERAMQIGNSDDRGK